MTVDSTGTLKTFTIVPQTEDPGRLWRELRGQVVLTYTSLFQEGSHKYSIEVKFPDSLSSTSTAYFEKDAVYYAGDPRSGQLSLTTTGIKNGSAEIYLRADYIPRNITQFRLRFIPSVPENLTPNLTGSERAALLARLQTALNNGAVKVVSGGLVDGWRMISSEGHGVFSLVTESTNYLTYASFGNMVKITFDGLGENEAFALGMRADNSIYYSPAGSGSASLTKYFLYPGCNLNPNGVLSVTADATSIAAPSLTIAGFAETFDPEAATAWDRDEDSWADFDDIGPDNAEVGDADKDGYPDLDDSAPLDPTTH
jgi:hypothetical protein